MKRIQSACLLQTLHFILDPSVPKEEAIAKVNAEVAKYKDNIRNNVKILEECALNDGSYLIKIKKKVSGYKSGTYFDD